MLIKYYIVLNFLGFILFGMDKIKAKKKKKRISEKTLFVVSLLGGAIGSYFGMKIFHHKTRKKAFQIGIPFLVCIHLFFILFAEVL